VSAQVVDERHRADEYNHYRTKGTEPVADLIASAGYLGDVSARGHSITVSSDIKSPFIRCLHLIEHLTQFGGEPWVLKLLQHLTQFGGEPRVLVSSVFYRELHSLVRAGIVRSPLRVILEPLQCRVSAQLVEHKRVQPVHGRIKGTVDVAVNSPRCPPRFAHRPSRQVTSDQLQSCHPVPPVVVDHVE
jgi:hypothetical protein